MNVLAPVSTLMTTKLVTVNPKDTLEAVNKIFKKTQNTPPSSRPL